MRVIFIHWCASYVLAQTTTAFIDASPSIDGAKHDRFPLSADDRREPYVLWEIIFPDSSSSHDILFRGVTLFPLSMHDAEVTTPIFFISLFIIFFTISSSFISQKDLRQTFQKKIRSSISSSFITLRDFDDAVVQAEAVRREMLIATQSRHGAWFFATYFTIDFAQVRSSSQHYHHFHHYAFPDKNCFILSTSLAAKDARETFWHHYHHIISIFLRTFATKHLRKHDFSR